MMVRLVKIIMVQTKLITTVHIESIIKITEYIIVIKQEPTLIIGE